MYTFLCMQPFTRSSWLLSLAATTACYEGALDLEPPDQFAREGVNGEFCEKSDYNCKLRAEGGNRVETNDEHDKDHWGLVIGVPIRDGNGDIVGTNSYAASMFNYGQVREFAGEKHAFAVSTSNGSAGWLPMSAIQGRASFEVKVRHVSAKGAALRKMGCYQVGNTHDEALAPLKVVRNSKSPNEKAGDYLPLPRKNEGQRRSVNLAFNVPGSGLGGPAVDHFPAGTRFQRLEVTTYDGGPPSIEIDVYGADANDDYILPVRKMKFIYGYVIAATGTKRNGWMALDALKAIDSGPCDGVAPPPPDEPPPPPPPPDEPPPPPPEEPPPPPPQDIPPEEPPPPPPDQPPPEPPPPDVPIPTPNQCYVRCCDESLQGPADVPDPTACHDNSKAMCDAHEHVKRSEWNGNLVWERPNTCWAKCWNREAYHQVDVAENCAAHATNYCNEGDRGGLEDAAWSQCQP